MRGDMKLEIEEASNGWVIKAFGESRREPRVFEFDGNNRFRTSLENIISTASRALNHILGEMVGSQHYKVVVTEDVEDPKPDSASSGVSEPGFETREISGRV